MSTAENKLIIKVDRSASIARLVEFGEQQGYITYDNILYILSEAQVLRRLRHPSILHMLRGYLGSN